MTILDSTKKDQSVLELLRRNDQAKHPKEEILPHDMRLYRFDLIQSFLTAGIPFSKIDCLRSFLEKYGHRLTSQSHLRELIPSVLQKEKETLKSELSEAKAVSTIFDGSTRLGEALAIIVRFVHSQWNVQQRLVRLQVLVKSLKLRASPVLDSSFGYRVCDPARCFVRCNEGRGICKLGSAATS